MKCENSQCNKRATREFIDGSKPINLMLCREHCADQAIYYGEEGYIFIVRKLPKVKQKNER